MTTQGFKFGLATFWSMLPVPGAAPTEEVLRQHQDPTELAKQMNIYFTKYAKVSQSVIKLFEVYGFQAPTSFNTQNSVEAFRKMREAGLHAIWDLRGMESLNPFDSHNDNPKVREKFYRDTMGDSVADTIVRTVRCVEVDEVMTKVFIETYEERVCDWP